MTSSSVSRTPSSLSTATTASSSTTPTTVASGSSHPAPKAEAEHVGGPPRRKARGISHDLESSRQRAALPATAFGRVMSLPHLGPATTFDDMRLLGSPSRSDVAECGSEPADIEAIEHLITPGAAAARRGQPLGSSDRAGPADGPAAMAERMAALVEGALSSLLPPGDLPNDVSARLEANTSVLLAKGIDTTQKLQAFLAQSWKHDRNLAFVGMGIAEGGGYAIGLTIAQEKLVAMLPPKVLGNPPLLGMVLGLGVGALDVVFNVVGGAMVSSQFYNDRSGNKKLPASIPVPAGGDEVMADAARSLKYNVLKNSLRLPAPYLQSLVAGGRDGTIDSVWADRLDGSVLDGGGGMVAAGLKAISTLTDAVPYDARLLLREDLGEVVDKTRQSWPEAARDATTAAGRGAAGLASPVALWITASVGMFVATLLPLNGALAASLSPADLPDGRAAVRATTARRAGSTMVFAGLTQWLSTTLPMVGEQSAKAGKAISENVVDPALAFLRAQAQSIEIPDVMAMVGEFFADPVFEDVAGSAVELQPDIETGVGDRRPTA